jgi:hypothetical protein
LRAKAAIQAIEKHGVLLVYPLKDKKDPLSLWSVAYPRSPMRWEWDENGDDRVARLWHLREELSRSKKVVYGKWYQGRATFFSRARFTDLLSLYLRAPKPLSRDSRLLLNVMEESSPRSTKELKRESNLQGRLLESTYHKAMKELWTRLLVAAFGEIDEGAFPSLAIGATSLLFEELFLEARSIPREKALGRLTSLSPALKRFLERSLASYGGA